MFSWVLPTVVKINPQFQLETAGILPTCCHLGTCINNVVAYLVHPDVHAPSGYFCTWPAEYRSHGGKTYLAIRSSKRVP